MARIDDLLLRVPDPQLRAELTSAIAEVRRTTDFGLVYESHLPETCRLPSHPIRRGVKVTLRSANDGSLYLVVSVNGPTAKLVRLRAADGVALGVDDQVPVERATGELVVVAEFGDAIYPGLKRVGSVSRGGDKPAHVVINGENHHALEALQFTHAGKVDCIYIDPPYNTGARDWKYNNNYVDANDGYRHSKWLAMMERRLRLAKKLLRPEDSALIVTIDEKEYLRLGLLLEQVFPSATTQMVSSVINPAGTGRQNEFSRTNEYIFFLQFGDLAVQPMMPTSTDQTPVEWEPFRRRDLQSVRPTRPRQFYPIYVDRQTGLIVGTGEPLPPEQDRQSAPRREGCASVFPVRDDGTEMNWSLTREEFERRLAQGFVRVGRHQPNGPQEYVISYLRTGPIADIESGKAVVVGRNKDGSVIAKYPEGKRRMPLTQWDFPSHDAQRYGTTLLQLFIRGRRFPFPKSLYAVEDVVRIAVGHKPEAVVLDYFSGSGTTAHAVARLNHQDDGRRQSICITNNEVSATEAASLARRGFHDGDPAWESQGIFEHITRPRIEAAITGRTPDGEPVKGDYKFVDEFPMAEGFEENFEFFALTYQDAAAVELDLAFEAIAPLLWLRAGGQGTVIERHDASGFAWAERYGVLLDTDRWQAFVASAPECATTAFIVTDSATAFASVASDLPAGIKPVRLYENYLTTFAINQVEAE